MWWAREQAACQVKPEIQHWDGTAGLGRDMHWACHRFSVSFFTPLWETFSVSRLVSKATCIIVNTAGWDLFSSPSSSGRVVIISISSHSFISVQGRSYLVCFLGTIPSPCCPPNQACSRGTGLPGASKAQLVRCRLLNSMVVHLPGHRSVLWPCLVYWFWCSPSSTST